MGLSYKACNNELDAVLENCLTQNPDRVVSVPWSSDSGLNREGRFAAIAAISSGAMGLAKNSTGKYKLYYGPSLAGNWFAEVWGTWKAATIAGVFSMCVWMLWQAVKHSPGMSLPSGSAAWGLVFAGVAGLGVFGVRALMSPRHAFVSLASARSFVGAAAPINTAMAVLSLGALVGGFRLVGSSYVSHVSWFSAVADLASYLFSMLGHSIGEDGAFRSLFGITAVCIVWGVVIGGIAGGVFSSIGFSYISAKAVTENVFNVLGYTSGIPMSMYQGSYFERANNTVLPQTGLIILVYMALLASLLVGSYGGFGVIK